MIRTFFRIYGLALLALLGLCVVAAVTLYTMDRTHLDSEDIFKRGMQQVNDLNKISFLTGQQRAIILNAPAERNLELLEDRFDSFQNYALEAIRRANDMSNHELANLLRELRMHGENVFTYARSFAHRDAQRYINDKMQPVIGNIEKTLDALQEQAADNARSGYARIVMVQADARHIILMICAGVSGLVFVLGLLVMLFSRPFKGNLPHLVRQINSTLIKVSAAAEVVKNEGVNNNTRAMHTAEHMDILAKSMASCAKDIQALEASLAPLETALQHEKRATTPASINDTDTPEAQLDTAQIPEPEEQTTAEDTSLFPALLTDLLAPLEAARTNLSQLTTLRHESRLLSLNAGIAAHHAGLHIKGSAGKETSLARAVENLARRLEIALTTLSSDLDNMQEKVSYISAASLAPAPTMSVEQQRTGTDDLPQTASHSTVTSLSLPTQKRMAKVSNEAFEDAFRKAASSAQIVPLEAAYSAHAGVLLRQVQEHVSTLKETLLLAQTQTDTAHTASKNTAESAYALQDHAESIFFNSRELEEKTRVFLEEWRNKSA